MYQWPDDRCWYSSPLNGYFWEPTADNPNAFTAARRLDPGETQLLPGGIVMDWEPPEGCRREPRTIDSTPLEERRTAVYRCYNRSGDLIYVGVAVDPDRRWQHHASHAPWWAEVGTKSIEWHANRGAALAVEASVIATEAPTYNVMGKPKS